MRQLNKAGGTATPTADRIGQLLKPYLAGQSASAVFLERCHTYLDLLLHWNGKTNLTAVRDPEQLVRRQLGESLFAASYLPASGALLDFGSGAGFPGIPIQLAHPALSVTLAESQGKKAAFLREAVRVLQLPCSVWPRRVEELAPSAQYDTVAMRAVDHSDAMLKAATARIQPSGRLLRFLAAAQPAQLDGWMCDADDAVPDGGRLVILRRSGHVPRGTS